MEETQMDAWRRAAPAELDLFCLPAGGEKISKFRSHVLFHVRKNGVFPFNISVYDCASNVRSLWGTRTHTKFHNLKYYPDTTYHPVSQNISNIHNLFKFLYPILRECLPSSSLREFII